MCDKFRMKISFKGDYALKVILDLADNYPNRMIHSEDIARRQNIPQKFLEQILLELKRGGFVQSKKGPGGGYSLSRYPKEISLGSVIRFIDGSVFPISCVDPSAKQPCDTLSSCVFSPIWKQVGSGISKIIDNIDFQQLKENLKKLKEKEVINYTI